MGRTIGFELFDLYDVEELAAGAARQAVTKLKARPAPSGALPVVIKRGSGGVLFHEACGHGLEADLVGKGASVYRGKVGEMVASSLVTLIDDGTMSGELTTKVITARRILLLKMVFSPTTCGTICVHVKRTICKVAMDVGKVTCIFRWCE
jgi:hypothetical protein